jgi:hypothetical protein
MINQGRPHSGPISMRQRHRLGHLTGRAKQCWIARCGWVPRRGTRGLVAAGGMRRKPLAGQPLDTRVLRGIVV